MSEPREQVRQQVIDLVLRLRDTEHDVEHDAERRLLFRLGEYLERTDAAPLDEQLRQAAP